MTSSRRHDAGRDVAHVSACVSGRDQGHAAAGHLRPRPPSRRCRRGRPDPPRREAPVQQQRQRQPRAAESSRSETAGAASSPWSRRTVGRRRTGPRDRLARRSRLGSGTAAVARWSSGHRGRRRCRFPRRFGPWCVGGRCRCRRSAPFGRQPPGVERRRARWVRSGVVVRGRLRGGSWCRLRVRRRSSRRLASRLPSGRGGRPPLRSRPRRDPTGRCCAQRHRTRTFWFTEGRASGRRGIVRRWKETV